MYKITLFIFSDDVIPVSEIIDTTIEQDAIDIVRELYPDSDIVRIEEV